MNFGGTKLFKKCYVKQEMNRKYSSKLDENVQKSNSISVKAQLIYVTLCKSYKINPKNAILCDREKKDTRKVVENCIIKIRISPHTFFAVCGEGGE